MSVAMVDDVLSRLDQVRQTRRGWSARCPAHADRSPSLSILRGRDGRSLLRCWVGCTRSEILCALNLDDDEPQPAPSAATRSTFSLALGIARRQAWHREETLLMYVISDMIRRRRRAALIARAIATRTGDRAEAWELLATAAGVECEAAAIEAELDAIMRGAA